MTWKQKLSYGWLWIVRYRGNGLALSLALARWNRRELWKLENMKSREEEELIGDWDRSEEKTWEIILEDGRIFKIQAHDKEEAIRDAIESAIWDSVDVCAFAGIMESSELRKPKIVSVMEIWT